MSNTRAFRPITNKYWTLASITNKEDTELAFVHLPHGNTTIDIVSEFDLPVDLTLNENDEAYYADEANFNRELHASEHADQEDTNQPFQNKFILPHSPPSYDPFSAIRNELLHNYMPPPRPLFLPPNCPLLTLSEAKSVESYYAWASTKGTVNAY